MFSRSNPSPSPAPLSVDSPSVRILVLGDPGVGKSTLIKLLCTENVNHNTKRTVGCYLDVKIHEHTRTGKNYFVEFVEVSRSRNKNSRDVFYNGINGIILVHDVSNRRSYSNLNKWLHDFTVGRARLRSSGSEASSPLPMLIVGTKTDLGFTPHRCVLSEEYKCDSFDMVRMVSSRESLTKKKSIVNASTLSNLSERFDRFYNRVVDKKFSPSSSNLPLPSMSQNDLYGRPRSTGPRRISVVGNSSASLTPHED